MTEKLSILERELRGAVEQQRFAEVRRLVLSFCEAAEGHIKSLPPGDPRITEIGNMTLELLHWSRTMVRSAREGLVLQLQQLPKVKRYIPPPAAVPAAMRLDV